MLTNFYEKMIDLMPYHLQDGPNINIVLKVFGRLLMEIMELNSDIESIGDIDSKGILLDETGIIVGEKRQGLNDFDFRNNIRFKLMSAFSDGSIEDLNEAMKVFMGDTFVRVDETWTDSKSPTECGLLVVYSGLVEKFMSQYNIDKNDIIYLDGTRLLDGKTLLNGGITVTWKDYYEELKKSMANFKELARTIKAGGVFLGWEDYSEVEELIKIQENVTIKENTNVEEEIILIESVSMSANANIIEKPVALLDGTRLLDGNRLLNGERNIIEEYVTMKETVKI